MIINILEISLFCSFEQRTEVQITLVLSGIPVYRKGIDSHHNHPRLIMKRPHYGQPYNLEITFVDYFQQLKKKSLFGKNC